MRLEGLFGYIFGIKFMIKLICNHDSSPGPDVPDQTMPEIQVF